MPDKRLPHVLSKSIGLISIIFLASFASFYIGTEYGKRQVPDTETPFVISVDEELRDRWFKNADSVNTVLASKSGSKYYFSWCNEIENLKPENIITFTSEEQAKNAGYELGSSCLSFETKP